MPLALALADDDLFLQHPAPSGHPEREARVHAVRRGLASVGPALELCRLPPRDASEHELERVHDVEHVQRLESTAGRSGYFDGDTYYGPRSYAAAVRAAGACISVVEELQREADYGFALVRPPGHHATAASPMGFCLFNNVAVAAAAALDAGLSRTAIVDWDVHHGNGTEDIFWARRDVLYVSLHQSPQYPGTGGRQRTGAGEGSGFTVNVPLAAGAGDAAYRQAFEQLVVPILRQYAPELLLVSAGYDAHARDPLGGMHVSDGGFGMMTQSLMSALPDAGRGRLAFVLEGGYDEQGLEGAVRSTLLATTGQDFATVGRDEVAPRHQQELRAAIDIQSHFWRLRDLDE